MLGDKIRIRLKAYDARVLDQSTGEIVETAKRTGARLARSNPVADRDQQVDCPTLAARRQEVARAVRSSDHKRLIDIFEPTPQTVDALMKLDLPAGVDVESRRLGKTISKAESLPGSEMTGQGELSAIAPPPASPLNW